MYVADCYVKINGQMHVRGEILPEGIPEETLKYLEKRGAIHMEAPFSNLPEDPDPEELTDPVDELPHEIAEEPEEEPDAPEVDVMAGIVQEDEKSEAKTQKGRRRKAK